MNSKRQGSLAMYSVIFVVLGIILAFFVFSPQFLETRTGIYGISCRDIRRKITVALEDYEANETKSMVRGGNKVDLDTLKVKGYLDQIKLCPENGVYMFSNDGKVICTVHEEGAKND